MGTGEGGECLEVLLSFMATSSHTTSPATSSLALGWQGPASSVCYPSMTWHGQTNPWGSLLVLKWPNGLFVNERWWDFTEDIKVWRDSSLALNCSKKMSNVFQNSSGDVPSSSSWYVMLACRVPFCSCIKNLRSCRNLIFFLLLCRSPAK